MDLTGAVWQRRVEPTSAGVRTTISARCYATCTYYYIRCETIEYDDGRVSVWSETGYERGDASGRADFRYARDAAPAKWIKHIVHMCATAKGHLPREHIIDFVTSALGSIA